jgi:hypothetical protein
MLSNKNEHMDGLQCSHPCLTPSQCVSFMSNNIFSGSINRFQSRSVGIVNSSIHSSGIF